MLDPKKKHFSTNREEYFSFFTLLVFEKSGGFTVTQASVFLLGFCCCFILERELSCLSYGDEMKIGNWIGE